MLMAIVDRFDERRSVEHDKAARRLAVRLGLDVLTNALELKKRSLLVHTITASSPELCRFVQLTPCRLELTDRRMRLTTHL